MQTAGQLDVAAGLSVLAAKRFARLGLDFAWLVRKAMLQQLRHTGCRRAIQRTRAAPEVSSSEETHTFKVKVNLVEVRVVVRDAQGHAIGNLKQEDFQLLDNGKPQVISKFSMEQSASKPRSRYHDTAETAVRTAEPPAGRLQQIVPQRYIAYLFDDIHLNFSDLAQARNAAEHQLQSLQPTDRAAIYSTSGQTQLDFTDDRAQLTATLNRLQPRPLAQTGITPCPNISYYMADLIENKQRSPGDVGRDTGHVITAAPTVTSLTVKPASQFRSRPRPGRN